MTTLHQCVTRIHPKLYSFTKDFQVNFRAYHNALPSLPDTQPAVMSWHQWTSFQVSATTTPQLALWWHSYCKHQIGEKQTKRTQWIRKKKLIKCYKTEHIAMNWVRDGLTGSAPAIFQFTLHHSSPGNPDCLHGFPCAFTTKTTRCTLFKKKNSVSWGIRERKGHVSEGSLSSYAP